MRNMKNVLVVFAAVLLIAAAPFVFKSLHNARIDSYSQSFAQVSTPPGVNSANVTLGLELYEDTIANISVCSSNLTGDSPSAAGYTIAGNILNISGLLSSSVRTLTIQYGIASQALFDIATASVFFNVLAYMYIFTMLGLMGGAIWNTFR